MTIFDKVKSDLLSSRKERDVVRSSILSTVLGDMEKLTKNIGRSPFTDVDAITLIKKYVENNVTTMKQNIGYERHLILARENLILSEYLPEQMSTHDMLNVLETLDCSDIGLVMKYFKTKYSGQYDGKVLSQLIKDR